MESDARVERRVRARAPILSEPSESQSAKWLLLLMLLSLQLLHVCVDARGKIGSKGAAAPQPQMDVEIG